MAETSMLQKFTGASRILAVGVVLALIAAVALVFSSRDSERTVTIDFEQVNSVYVGSDVKVLGVPIGRVTKMTPRGDVVRVEVAYDGKHQLPNDVKAVVVSPSIVGDRFIQLAPAFSGGTPLEDKAFIPVDRTAVPVELDEIYQSLDDFSRALGPQGANKEGSFSSLIDSTAEQLDGEGAQLNETIRNFGKLSTTLANNKDELFGSLGEVQDFVALLKENDAAVRSFNDSTAQVSTVLEGERDDLARTLKALSQALIDVDRLVKDNRSELRANVDNLTSLTNLLARHEKDLADYSIIAPTALTNLALTYNPRYGTLDNRGNIEELILGTVSDPAALLCNLLGEAPVETGLCSTLEDVLGGLPPLALPRAAAGSEAVAEQSHTSVADMLAVN